MERYRTRLWRAPPPADLAYAVEFPARLVLMSDSAGTCCRKLATGASARSIALGARFSAGRGIAWSSSARVGSCPRSTLSSRLVSNRDLAEPDFKGVLMGTAGSNRRVGGRFGAFATRLLLVREVLLAACYLYTRRPGPVQQCNSGASLPHGPYRSSPSSEVALSATCCPWRDCASDRTS